MAVVVVVGFVLGGNEDSWICQFGQWVKHGNPSSAKPDGGCEQGVINRTKERLEDISVCYSPNGGRMDFVKAKEIAKNYCVEGELKDEHFCNETKGTWWIYFQPNNPKKDCNPVCIVDVEKETAELNWRCAGVVNPEN